jgi:hypothetical protein
MRTGAFKLALLACALGQSAHAQPVPQTVVGLPEQVIPSILEKGAPTVVFVSPTVTSSPGFSETGVAARAGADDAGVLDKMEAQSWGQQASSNAEAVGISAVALASTCVLESGCASSTGSNGSISGTFQMLDSTYKTMLAHAGASNPALSSVIVSGAAGKLDPANQSIAAAQYMKEGALALQSPSIPNPTVLDVRGYYNFGPANAAAIAGAPDGSLMSSAVPNLTADQMVANGIKPASTTVGQWRAGIVSKIGSAAATPVLLN